jgi:Tautomerase enzyme
MPGRVGRGARRGRFLCGCPPQFGVGLIWRASSPGTVGVEWLKRGLCCSKKRALPPVRMGGRNGEGSMGGVTIGMDPHEASATIEVLDGGERVLGGGGDVRCGGGRRRVGWAAVPTAGTASPEPDLDSLLLAGDGRQCVSFEAGQARGLTIPFRTRPTRLGDAMPLVRIDLARGKPAGYRRAIVEVVYTAMVEALDAPKMTASWSSPSTRITASSSTPPTLGSTGPPAPC